METHLRVAQYRVLFDRQKDGFPASSASCVRRGDRLLLSFQLASDAAAGLRTFLTTSDDGGATWSPPEPFGPVLRDPANEFQGVGLAGVTRAGTDLAVGFHLARGIRTNEDLRWRPGSALIGRRPAGTRGFAWVRYPPDTFLGEQFAAPGLVLRSGRICLTVYGAKTRDDNWRSGVLLSDDDGRSWRYREVAYEPDRAIRFDPAMPAGFNEQTLFEAADGTLVSLLRGREGLGDSPRQEDEPFFFRAVSTDGGERWQTPERTNLRGTGAACSGLTLPDGSLLLPARIPAHAPDNWVRRDRTDLFGLHLARSFDLGRTWQTEQLIQFDPDGQPFDNYYNAMNGQFVRLENNRFLYVFGHFDHPRNRHRVLSLEVAWD
jgi:hypothetical protein